MAVANARTRMASSSSTSRPEWAPSEKDFAFTDTEWVEGFLKEQKVHMFARFADTTARMAGPGIMAKTPSVTSRIVGGRWSDDGQEMWVCYAYSEMNDQKTAVYVQVRWMKKEELVDEYPRALKSYRHDRLAVTRDKPSTGWWCMGCCTIKPDIDEKDDDELIGLPQTPGDLYDASKPFSHLDYAPAYCDIDFDKVKACWKAEFE